MSSTLTIPADEVADLDQQAASRRIEVLFSKIGLSLSVLLVLFAVLAVDIALSGPPPPTAEAFAEAITLNLVSRDGRRIGSSVFGIEMILSPRAFYRNRPLQNTGQYRTNALGCRGPEIDPAHRRARVLILGGSTAFGLGVAETATFAGQLAVRHPGMEIINAGTVGYVSEQELAFTFFYLADLKPELIIDFSGWNDLYSSYWQLNMGLVENLSGTSNNSFLVMEDRLAKLREMERSLWSAGREITRWAVSRSTILSGLAVWGGDRSDPFRSRFDAAAVATIVRSFAHNMSRLRDFAGQIDAELLVVIQPEVSQTISPDNLAWLRDNTRDYLPGDRYWIEYPSYYTRFRRQAITALEQRGITVIDASEYLVARGLGAGLFTDPVHLNASGHTEMANLLARHLEELNGRVSRNR